MYEYKTMTLAQLKPKNSKLLLIAQKDQILSYRNFSVACILKMAANDFHDPEIKLKNRI